jgi:hypothetical protein
MRVLESVALTILVGLVAAAPVAGAQAAGDRPKVPTGVVSGVVTRDGKPAAGVGVLLGPDDYSYMTSDRKAIATAVTGADGSYRLEGAPAGALAVSVDAPGFIVKGATSWRRNGRNLSLADGEIVTGFDLQLEPGGAITGRVTTEGGRPVVGQRITVKQIESDGTAREISAHVVGFGTDDRGIYRVYGLPPGRYVVGAGLGDGPGGSSFGEGRRYRLTFHPAAADERQAEPVAVAAGGETAGVDILLPKGEAMRQASGTFVYADTGQPAAGVSILHGSISEDGRTASWMGTGVSDDAGAWRVTGLKPGKLVIAGRPEKGSPYFVRPVEIVVSDSDVEGLVVSLERGATISGTVELEGGARPAWQLDALDISLVRADEERTQRGTDPWPPNARAAADGSFTLTGVPPDIFELRIGGRNLKPVPVLVAAERGGAPLDGPLTIRGVEVLGDVRLRVAVGTGAVRGTVRLANAPEAVRGWAYVRRVSPKSHRAQQIVDARGQFVVGDLPAGEYSVKVTFFMPTGSTYREASSEEKRVVVADGQTREVALEVDFAPKEGTDR